MITEERVLDFIRSFGVDRGSEALHMIEKEAIRDDVPIIRKESGELLRILLQIKKPEKILEVGAAIGFSSVFMGENTDNNTHCLLYTSVNQYETDAMEEILEKAGYEIVSFKETADVYIINTCSVTNMADRKSRQMIHRAKKNNPDAIIVAAGCYVQAAEEELAKKNEADILVGNNKKKDIAQILEEYFAAKEPEQEVPVVSEVIDINHTKEYEDLTIHKVNEHTRAYIKIQDGCNQFCSYCIIPYTRGRIRSKNPEEVIEEVKNLAAQGYKEIVLTGIHLSSYGKDLGTVTLLDVIKRIPVSYTHLDVYKRQQLSVWQQTYRDVPIR